MNLIFSSSRSTERNNNGNVGGLRKTKKGRSNLCVSFNLCWLLRRTTEFHKTFNINLDKRSSFISRWSRLIRYLKEKPETERHTQHVTQHRYVHMRLTRKRIILDHPPWRFKNETFRLPKGKKEGNKRNNKLHTEDSDEDFLRQIFDKKNLQNVKDTCRKCHVANCALGS